MARTSRGKSLNCFIQLLRREVLDLLVINQPKVEEMIQALEAYGAEGGQSEEELCEASVFIRMLLSTVFVEARINFRSKQINLRPTLEDANIW